MDKNISDLLMRVSGVDSGDLNLEIVGNESFGDYTSNIALRNKGKNSRETAQKMVDKLSENEKVMSVFEKVEIAGPGFINFWLKKDVLVNNLKEIENKSGKYGSSELGKGKTVIVDYSSPNIAKPFGIGHLRSTIIGQALYNLFKFLGYETIGDNHLGDWGTQFGKLLCMLETFPNEEMEKLTIADLERFYVEYHQKAKEDQTLEEKARNWFKKLEDGDALARKLWKHCVDISLAEFEKVYQLLGVKIDFAFGESYYESEMKQLMNDPKIDKFITEGEDGAKIIGLDTEGIDTPLMFLKGDGATTYATRDLAAISFRARKWNPDIIIYEVGAEQTLHFRQVFAAAKKIGIIKKETELVHTAHGLYLAPDGKKFSTRQGKTIKLMEVLEEAIAKAKELGSDTEKVAKIVGIGAIKYFDLMHAVGTDVVFDWDKILNLEGNSGPYLQYTYARTRSVLGKVGETKGNLEVGEINKEEMIVLRHLYKFSEMVIKAANTYSPNVICNYLYELAQKYNSFYNSHKIIGGENQDFRILLTNAVGIVIKNGLSLLGIESPEKM